MAQLKEDLLLEKEQAIQEERKQCEKKLAQERQVKCDEKKDDQVIVSSLKLNTIYNHYIQIKLYFIKIITFILYFVFLDYETTTTVCDVSNYKCIKYQISMLECYLMNLICFYILIYKRVRTFYNTQTI